jgi:PAS domain S-box-containing protein
VNSLIEPETYVRTAVDALSAGDGWRAALDQLPIPVYTTDASGAVTHWNQACVDFAGREPQLGSDRWCVTWELYTTTGERLPHESCPMAQAIQQEKPIRGSIAIALRPDGSRRAFKAYPTPLFDELGRLDGAVNLLIDVTDEQSCELADQASRCRRLAKATHDPQASQILGSMAKGYARTASSLRETH